MFVYIRIGLSVCECVYVFLCFCESVCLAPSVGSGCCVSVFLCVGICLCETHVHWDARCFFFDMTIIHSFTAVYIIRFAMGLRVVCRVHGFFMSAFNSEPKVFDA